MAAPKTKPAPEVTDAKLAALVAAAGADYPETWIPGKAGDVIAGVFKRLETGYTEFGPSPLVVIETEDGAERSVWLLHASVLDQFVRIAPESGDNVAVLYLGKQPVKHPQAGRAKEFHAYRVTSDKKTAETAWANLAPKNAETTEDDIPF